ncbi:MAG: 3-deoxy-manno-octulosonate cytidylyltransferase [Desulfovibrionaceae bacterium]|nr:3-deoxy-manno-octulosonate cytidylyltransferase [Desulfovibrionaceae bacterium]
MTKYKFYGIIPARHASTRFPGKPLAPILGKPMFQHVYERASRCLRLERTVLATDDKRIAAAAEAAGVPFVMTSPSHRSGSDRVYEAALRLGLDNNSVVLNIQGDEPALDPGHIDCLIAPFLNDSAVRVSTLAHPVGAAEAENPNRVKVVLAKNNDALCFSRSAIPYVRNAPEDAGEPVYFGHIGLYAYTMEALELFTRLPQSLLERLEGLEQLRFLENNIPIRVGMVTRPSQAVDVPEDIALVEQILLSEK